jgi:hypothetical protein
MPDMRNGRRCVTGALVILVCCPTTHAQPSPRSHVVIPFLANAAKPDALEFEGAECETAADGLSMRCEFQQVFLTTSQVAPDTCLVTTNRYERTFDRQAEGRWSSRDAPQGSCGVQTLVTLRDAGGVRWTMEIRKAATRNQAAASCAAEAESDILSWQNLRRPLPCRFVQPGGLSR